MSQNFKIVVESNNQRKRVFIIKPYLYDFDNFKNEIFLRMPQLKGKLLEYFYEGQLEGFFIYLFHSIYLCDFNNCIEIFSRC